LESFYPGAKILLVDGEETSSSSVLKALEQMGHETVLCASAETALEILDQIRPDLVLAGAKLPGADGFAFCRAVKAHPQWQDIPLLVMTGSNALDDRVRGLDCGADDVLVPSLEPAELRARIDRRLGDRNQIPYARESQATLSAVVRGAEQALSGFQANPTAPHAGLPGAAQRLLTHGSEEDRPGAVLLHTHNGDEGGDTRTLFRLGVDGDLESVNLASSLDECPPHSQSENPWALHDVSWSNDAAGRFAPDTERAVGTLRNFVRAPILGGCVTAFNFARRATRLDAQRIQGLAAHAAWLQAVAVRVEDAETAFLGVVKILAQTCEGEYPDAAAHVRRISAFTGLLAETLGLGREFVTTISYSAQLHDVGKTKLPRGILDKPGPLTVAEFDVVKRHTVYGTEILSGHQRLAMAREIALGHHERWDGTGYPEGRVGESIPLPARITALADVYDALRTRQRYRDAHDHPATVEIITRGDWRTSPEHFDPAVLDAFQQIEGLFEEHHESSEIAVPR
jgi:response regulator RpfG family c-di-GMP phosphodiesterase